MNYKDWYSSNTIQIMALAFAGGGEEVIRNFIITGEISWQSVSFMILALVGILLRIKTTQPLK